MKKQKTQNEIRCYCRRKPLLAVFGLNEKGKPYVHVKVFKNRRIFGEILVTRGDIQLRCRECLRWYSITINEGRPKLTETSEPEQLGDDSTPGMIDSTVT